MPHSRSQRIAIKSINNIYLSCSLGNKFRYKMQCDTKCEFELRYLKHLKLVRTRGKGFID